MAVARAGDIQIANTMELLRRMPPAGTHFGGGGLVMDIALDVSVRECYNMQVQAGGGNSIQVTWWTLPKQAQPFWRVSGRSTMTMRGRVLLRAISLW